jgi:hypothetical protein
VQLFQADELIGFMALLHAARAAYHRWNSRCIEQAALGTERHRAEVPGAGKRSDQLRRFAAGIGGQAGVRRQFTETNVAVLTHGAHAWQQMLFGIGLQFLCNP